MIILKKFILDNLFIKIILDIAFKIPLSNFILTIKTYLDYNFIYEDLFQVFITATPVTLATRFLPNIVKAITEMPEDCKRHCRQKTKFLLERLSRKFGFDLVSSLVPKSDLTTQKRLRNIRKEVARRSRKVSEDGSGGDDEDFAVKSNRQKTMEEILADSSDDEFDEQVKKEVS